MTFNNANSRIMRLSVAYIAVYSCLLMCRHGSAADTQKDLPNPICEHEFASSLKIKINAVQMRKFDQKMFRVVTTLYTPGAVVVPRCAEIHYEFLGLDASNATEYKKVVDAYQIKSLVLAKIDDKVLTEAGKAGLFDGLVHLEIRNSPKITSLDPLSLSNNPDALQSLVISCCQRLTDITAIGQYRNLQTLSLNGTAVRDISPLKNLKSLVKLDLSENPITDISALSKMRKLSILRLGSTDIQDITPLASLKNLTQLNLGRKVRNIEALASLTKLTSLCLGMNGVEDTMPLAGLTNLESLYLGDTNVKDLAPLAKLKNLKHLSLDKATESDPDFSPLFQLEKLRKIQHTGDLAPETMEALKMHLPQCHVTTWSD